MKKLTNLDKTLTSIASIAFVVWLGGSIFRLLIGFDIFIPGTNILKGYSDELSLHLSQLYAVTAPYADISFIVLFLICVYLAIKFSKQLKEYGWLFMIFVIIFLLSIPNGVLFYYDYHLVIAAAKEGITFNSPEIQKYFLDRFINVNYLDPIVLISGLSIPILLAFRPLSNKINKNSINK